MTLITFFLNKNMKTNTKYTIGKNENEINIEIVHPHDWDGKRAQLLIFGIGMSASFYKQKRIEKLEDKMIENGSALITFNFKKYFEHTKNENIFYSSNKIINFALETIEFINNKYKNIEVDVIGWSFGALSAFYLAEKFEIKNISNVVFMVPTFKPSVKFHAKRIQRQFNYENEISEDNINSSIIEFEENFNEVGPFEKFKGNTLIFYAENDKKEVMENSSFLKENSKIIILPKANHALTFAFNPIDEHSQEEIEEQNVIIWEKYVNELSKFIFKN